MCDVQGGPGFGRYVSVQKSAEVPGYFVHPDTHEERHSLSLRLLESARLDYS